MRTIDIHAAKAELSRLIDEAAAGDEIIITRAGKPLARLAPLAPSGERKAKRILGLMAGQLRISEDFDAPLPEDILDGFGLSENWSR